MFVNVNIMKYKLLGTFSLFVSHEAKMICNTLISPPLPPTIPQP